MIGGTVTQAVRDWIRAASGIAITDENAAPVELAIRLDAERRRMSPEALLSGVMSGRLEAQPLIDAITTNESYFFRAEKQMDLTVGELLPERLRREPGRPQRLLSLPCARGEEPYSIAMLLRERGIADASVMLVGADISAGCLADARRGEYNALALRRTAPARAQRWFRPLGGRRYRLDPSIVARVALHRLNLLSESVAVLNGPFDIVFCQNLLIYFDEPTIARALAILRRLMRSDGWLFVDHSEWNLPRASFLMQERKGCVGFRPTTEPDGRRLGADQPASRRLQPAVYGRGNAAAAGASGSRVQSSDGASAVGPARGPAGAGVGRSVGVTPAVGRNAGSDARSDASVADAKQRPGGAPGAAASGANAAVPKPAVPAAPGSSDAVAGGGDPGALLDAYDAVLARRPRDASALLGKARVLADGGDELEALEALELFISGLEQELVRPSPEERIEALALFGLLLQRKGLSKLATSYFDQLARLSPQHPVLKLRGAPDA